jgi:uncharacterized protein YggT (Ycf19 family)
MNPSAAPNWYIDTASLVLAALSYLLIVRVLLDLTLGAFGDNGLFRALRRITDPVVGVVGAITPRIVPGALVSSCALLWILAARIVLVQVGAAMSMRRMMG